VSKAALLILEGRDAGRIFPIAKFPYSIGRLQENELVLADDQVSRVHARIEDGPTGLTLVDMKSRNGVFVDDRKVSRHLLKAGDRIRFGSTTLVFHTDVETAREVIKDSIPDAPAFAMEAEERSVSKSMGFHEEPTSIQYAPEHPDYGVGNKALSQIVKLLTSQVPPRDCAASIVDIFFQFYGPDRAQIHWKVGKEDFSVARSRKEGRNAPPIEMPPEILAKVGAQPLVSQSPERSILLAPLFSTTGKAGWLYSDRSGSQGAFTSAEVEQFQVLSFVIGGILSRAGFMQENKRLNSQMKRLEKHLSPEVARMLNAKEVSIEESDIGVSEKTVTILFADIKGFTPLSERLSAEDLAALLNEYFQRMVETINTHHGHLNKFIGDAVMALFGAPESHGNDAVNGVSAALGMITALKEFWKQISEDKRFHIRIGINTGKVVAGNIGSEKKMEYTVLGDAVNLASRLEGVAGIDSITIGPETARLVKDYFKLEKLPTVQVKGKTEAIQVYKVLGKI
jgi:adenylate cyclase